MNGYALLLPAVQAAREAGRRKQCANNVKQIGLGLHNYHDTFKTLPPGSNCDWLKNRNHRHCHGWVEMLFPYIEQAAMHDQIDFNTLTNSTQNVAILSSESMGEIKLSLLVCPSDGDAGALDNYRTNKYASAGYSYLPTKTPKRKGTFSLAQSYCPSGGPLELGNCPVPPIPRNGTIGFNCRREFRSGREDYGSPGMFAPSRVCYKIRDCTDGTSNTLLLGDQVPVYNHHMMYYHGTANVCTSNPPPNYVISKNPRECKRDPDGDAFKADCHSDSWGFNSRHPGGVNMSLTDGSVRFISETVDYVTWQLLATRDDGEPVSDF